MGLKINGSTSGSIEIDVPAVAGTDTAITIPATTGGEFIVSDASGNVDLGALDISGSASADSVNIDASGRLLVGTTSAPSSTAVFAGRSDGGDAPLVRFDTNNSAPADGEQLGNLYFGTTADTAFNSGARIIARRDGGTWTANTSLPTRVEFYTTVDGASSPTERMRINNLGEFFAYDVYNSTSASTANVVVVSSGRMVRSTSSGKYKTDIETLEDSYADALLNCRPVWYRSTCKADNPDYGWWGFIAEEVAAIDPRLVHWKTVEVSYDDNGSAVESPCDPEPEGVAYDRFVPHLLNLIKRQKEQIESQATQLASLEARLTALEGGAS